MKKIIVINGPNLNLLGQREISTYGQENWEEIEKRLKTTASQHKWEIQFFQNNSEGKIIDFLHEILTTTEERLPTGIIINAGAFTHTSLAIRDALSAFPAIPLIEVHISNVYKRESFRHHSYLSDIATGIIVGLGSRGYDLALSYFLITHR